MYKCSECGAEYDIKPDFCDCGNDVFTETEGSAKSQKSETPAKTQPKKQTYSKKTFEEQYPEFDRLRQVFDPISTAIFMICIITGLLVLFVIGNPEKKEVITKAEKEKPQVTENIPSIDSLWDNSTDGVINNEKTLAAKRASQSASQTQPQAQQPINSMLAKVENAINSPTPVSQGKAPQQIIPTPTPVPNQQPQPQVQTKPKTQTPVQSQPKAQPQSKPAAQTNTQKTTTPVANVPKTTATTTPNIPKNTQTAATQTKPKSSGPRDPLANYDPFSNSQTKPSTASTTTSKTSTQTQTQKPAQTRSQTQKTSQVPVQTTIRPKTTIDTQALQKELNNYKVGLRNTIGRKIDFANVIGDGDCVVSFNVASNGKLTNRKFSKQSSNVTLNDAVYRAVMATPSYNPPPSGYNNETMNLKIRFYNGNFDISLN